ncbi:oligosaccharide flippase family protein [Marinobacter salarius]|jgi:O-antigen/teichoic acid export membrane protein|uniref:oligosaccharide flippase family protein n=1 Tax=Marinobacter salarius TaxID=1420917 RepID=UPI0022B08EA9|nr:oligosaccharide flippase family protein [Marinobacter salarius]MCZ4285706.1 oligosaccharide flippase family protein [Marinobacter salarius]
MLSSVASVSLMKIVTQALVVVTSIVIARFFGIEVVGTYAFFMTLLSILVLVSSVGTDNVIIQAVARANTGSIRYRNRVLSSSLVIRLVFLLFSFLIIFIYMNYFSKIHIEKEVQIVLFFSALLLSVLGGYSSFLLGSGNPLLSTFIFEFLQSFCRILMVILLALFVSPEHFNSLAFGNFLVLLFIAIVFQVALFKKFCFKIVRSNVRVVFLLLKRGFPLFLSSSSWMVMLYTDIVFLSTFSNVETVGGYSVGQKLSAGMAIFLSSVNAVFGKRFAENFRQRNTMGIERDLHVSTAVLFALSSISLIIVAFFSSEIMGLWGKDFERFGVIFLILIIGQFFNTATGSVGLLLIMGGKRLLVAKITATSAVLNIVLNLVLVPAFGGTGAAIATAISLIVLNMLFVFYVRKDFGVYPLSFNMSLLKGT